MSQGDDRREPGFTLRRWSQRKLAAKRASVAASQTQPGVVAPVGVARPEFTGMLNGSPQAGSVVNEAEVNPRAAGTPEGGLPPVMPVAPGDVTAPSQLRQLQPVETLEFGSDFRPFLRPEVDEGLRQQALRKLFHDPRFNVMDGLDVYIDDYSKPDPIAAEMLAQLAHAQWVLDPSLAQTDPKGVPTEPREVPTPTPEVNVSCKKVCAGDSGGEREPENALDPDAEVGEVASTRGDEGACRSIEMQRT